MPSSSSGCHWSIVVDKVDSGYGVDLGFFLRDHMAAFMAQEETAKE